MITEPTHCECSLNVEQMQHRSEWLVASCDVGGLIGIQFDYLISARVGLNLSIIVKSAYLIARFERESDRSIEGSKCVKFHCFNDANSIEIGINWLKDIFFFQLKFFHIWRKNHFWI